MVFRHMYHEMLLNASFSGSINSPEMPSGSSAKTFLPSLYDLYRALAGGQWRRTKDQKMLLFVILAIKSLSSSSSRYSLYALKSLIACRLLALDHSSSSGVRALESTKHKPPARAARRKKYPMFNSPVLNCGRFIPKNDQAKLSRMKMKATVVSLKIRTSQ
jgi:hypothetical protein